MWPSGSTGTKVSGSALALPPFVVQQLGVAKRVVMKAVRVVVQDSCRDG